jgi:hypothetical protein
MNKTLFQYRLGNILNGTESLTAEEIATINSIIAVEIPEEIEEEEEDEDVSSFKFGI